MKGLEIWIQRAVRRSLFGPVDHEQLQRELSQRLQDITEQDSRRWNFDFQSHTPLPGPFQWEEVSSDLSATFYSDHLLTLGRMHPQGERVCQPGQQPLFKASPTKYTKGLACASSFTCYCSVSLR
uniref:Cyclin-dependent kinase inhibitor domain-containing protein n=1 Tax=Periophthalmus magnuspinnatus TaxID=409849 RepID=A0A3B4AFJ2_9GOBI